MTTDVRIDKTRATDYETIFILRADIDSDASERAISRAVGAIEQTSGKLLKIETWGKRRLAFPIGKQRKGFYVYVRFLGYRGTVVELERNLRMLDTVLRHMTVQIRKDVDPGEVTVDPEEIKVRRIEITEEGENDREDSVEASLGLADDQRPEPRRERRPEHDAPDGPAADGPAAGAGAAAAAPAAPAAAATGDGAAAAPSEGAPTPPASSGGGSAGGNEGKA